MQKHGAMMCLLVDDEIDEIQRNNIKKKKKQSLSIFTPYFQNKFVIFS